MTKKASSLTIILKNKLAFHFSHKSIDEAFRFGKFPIKTDVSSLKDAMEQRSSAALIDRKRQCRSSRFLINEMGQPLRKISNIVLLLS